jgi:hypothetical protein
MRLPAAKGPATACLALALLLGALSAPAAQADFGFLPGAEGFEVEASNEDGSPDTQAGSHPFELTTTVNFKLGDEFPGQPGVPFSDGDVKDLRIELPPGLIENPNALARCTAAQFHTPRLSPFEASRSGESCPDRSQAGVVAVRSSFGGGSTRYFGVFNLDPPPGVPAELGFAPYGEPITLTPHIRGAQGEYAVSLDSSNISQTVDLYGLSLRIWGIPWRLIHNTERGNCLNEAEPSFPWAKCSTGRPRFFPPRAYLTLPTSCAGPLAFAVSAESWQQGTTATATSLGPSALEGCGALGPQTTASALPTTVQAASASGLDFELAANQEGLISPTGRAPSQIRKAVLTLPEGITINPSLGAGLGVCTPAQYAAESASPAPGAGGPNAAKIGDVLLQSPLFEETVPGSLYLAQPDDPATSAPGAENPFNSLLALYIIARSQARGILVKVAGEVSADPGSGQLTASFDNLPQLPYTRFRLHFREGQRSALLTPPACANYSAHTDLTPWLDPNAQIHDSSQFQIAAGAGGGLCPSGGAPPFRPAAKAGTLNVNAGSYSPFYLHLTRTDAEQEITSYSAQLAPGLLGKIANIPYCPEAAIEASKTQSGTESKEQPLCPQASEIGHTIAGYGVGPVLAYAPGKLFLAGPYHGAPLSVVAIDSALVGPFDLGTVVIRSAIEVDRRSARVSVDSAGSDPIPHILQGIPLHLRDIRVYIDRPNFTLNPTSCDPFTITSALSGSGARFSDPSDDSTASASNPFQVAFCSSLGFKPRFSIRLQGATKRGGHPSLKAVYRPRAGDANIASAAVTLPPTEFLAQSHIHGICTGPQLRAQACPPGSVYGKARAFTPLLAKPLEGPVYLRSSDSALPDLGVSLKGQGIAIVLEGRIDSSHAGIRARFEGLPDAPVSKFVFTLEGGRRAILENGGADLCAGAPPAKARLIGQNNRGSALSPALEAKCKKQRPGRAKHKRGGRG